MNGVAFSPDGRLVASWSDDHSARLHDLRTGEARVLEGHGDEVWSLAFSADGALAVTAGKDATLRVWDTATGAPRHTLSAGQQPFSRASFLAGGERLVSLGGDRALRVWELSSGRSRVLADERVRVVFAADHRHALSSGPDGRLALHDLLAGTTVAAPPALRVLDDRKRVGPASPMSLSDDGALVVAGTSSLEFTLGDKPMPGRVFLAAIKP